MLVMQVVHLMAATTVAMFMVMAAARTPVLQPALSVVRVMT
jgi:hypothetical protein